MRRTALLTLLMLLALLSAKPGQAAPSTPVDGPVSITGYVLVETTGGPPAGAAGRVEHLFDNWYRVYHAPGQGMAAAMASTAALPGVVGVHRDSIVYADSPPAAPAALEPSDAEYDRQWHMPQVQAEDAWDVVDGTGVVVAILDTGVDDQGGVDGFCLPLHSTFNATTSSFGYVDRYGHGTHVAGTAAGCTGNGVGVTGLAYGAQIMAVKVLNDGGSGSASSVAAGIVWAADHGAQVINMSLGAPCSTDWPSCSEAIYNDALAYAAAADVVIVASAGNSERGFVGTPANHPEVLAVSAMDYARNRAWYSNWGTAVDLGAPGGDTRPGVDLNNDGFRDGVLQETFDRTTGVWNYYYYQGTSMSAPHVTGAVALLRSCAPEATRLEVMNALYDSAEDRGAAGRDDVYGHGFLQIYDALELLAVAMGRDVADHCAFLDGLPCRTLTTAVVGAGEVTIGPDSDCDAAGTPGFTYATPLNLAATADFGYYFAGWSGDARGTANPLVKPIYRDLAVTAAFRPCLTVSVATQGPGSVAVSPPPNCGGTGYAGGTSVTLTPTPDPGYFFDQWTGGQTGTTAPRTVTLADDLSVTAVFAACLSVTTHANGPGAVSVTPAPNCAGGVGYNGRTVVTLTAVPDPGYTFTGWSGGVTGATNPRNVTLAADLDVTATFVDVPIPTISLLANGSAGGLAYRDEDVIRRSGAAWAMVFDGSTRNLGGDVDALAVLDDGTLLLSTDAPVKGLPGAGGAVDDSDVVRFNPTTRQYSMYFDGSDVGLATNAEDVDALALLPDGTLLISTLGAAKVPGLNAADEDVLAFTFNGPPGGDDGRQFRVLRGWQRSARPAGGHRRHRRGRLDAVLLRCRGVCAGRADDWRRRHCALPGIDAGRDHELRRSGPHLAGDGQWAGGGQY